MSWRMSLRHTTGYRYDTPVSSSYNEARLVPQTGSDQLTLESRIEISPTVKQQRYWDYWGTQVTAFDVHTPHTELEVTATSLVDTAGEKGPPQDIDWERLGSEQVRDKFVELLVPSGRTMPGAELVAVAAETAAGRSPFQTAETLLALVHDEVAYRPGTTGVSTSALQAWQSRQGVCQDIAHVSIALLRAASIPARYVSGYLHPGGKRASIGETTSGESHAWVELWLGAWWPFDPTGAVPVGERHVVVARGRDYGDVPPLKGIYSGGGSQRLGVVVEITRVS